MLYLPSYGITFLAFVRNISDTGCVIKPLKLRDTVLQSRSEFYDVIG
jgi:hypothetical protein